VTKPKIPCELLVHGAQAVHADAGDPLPGADALVVAAGRIAALGTAADLRRRFVAAAELDAAGGLVAPGFVDAHTHPAFARDRAEEFDWRAQGLSYVEIHARGGGIHSSVRGVREASETRLTACVAAHFQRMLRHGTTTCEAKSGYGLSTDEELKSLRAIRAAALATGMTAVPTFLGAHLVPEEFAGQPDRYLDLLCAESLPAVKEAGLAGAADIYVEGHAFDLGRARRYLERARELGFRLRVHAEQFDNMGGAALAAELGADCADHLEALDGQGIAALAASGRTFAGLLPAVPHFLRQSQDAPARALIEAGVPYFVATDFNPGTCYTASMPEALHFARVRLNLSAKEAFAGATSLAAASLGLAERKGRLAVGADADLIVLDLPSLGHLGYGFGENPVRATVAGGRVVHRAIC